MRVATNVDAWSVCVDADLFILSAGGRRQQVQQLLNELCTAVGIGPPVLRMRDTPQAGILMPGGWAESIRWARRGDGIFLVRADLMFAQALPMRDCGWGADIQMPWSRREGKKTLHNDLFAFIAAPAAVAAALEAEQARKPKLTSLHSIHMYGGLSVGAIVQGHTGATLSRNPYYTLIGRE